MNLVVKLLIFVMIIGSSLASNLFGDLSSILEPVSYQNVSRPVQQTTQITTITHNPALESQPEKIVFKQVPQNNVQITKVSIDEVLLHVSNFLFQRFPIHGELKLSALNRWNDITFEGNDYQLQILNGSNLEIKPSMIVSFRIVTKNGEVGKWALPIRCELYQDVYFSGQRMMRGASLLNSGLYSKSVDVLSYNNGLISADIDLGEYEVVKLLSPDNPLSWRDIVKTPNIRKGKVVDLIAEEAGMRIATKAIALESGITSDFIKVRNLDSRKDLQAQILNDNTVKVYF